MRHLKGLYAQVIVAVLLGILVGAAFPAFGQSLKPLGDGFVKLVKMLVGPIIFCTVVHGVASMGDLKRLGKLGLRTIVYFELVSTLALALGLLYANLVRPGDGFPVGSFAAHAAETARGFADKSHGLSVADFLLKTIPETVLSAFVSGDLLQVLLVSVLVSAALLSMGERGQPILNFIELASELFFGILAFVVKLAPIGAFGAMAFTVGSFGLKALANLGWLVFGFYAVSVLFVLVVLGAIAKWSGFSIFRVIGHLKEELLLVLGTSSSETALPGVMKKLEGLGCKRSTIGLVIPLGYSFNLDGTNIYMTMAAVFLAQATRTPLDLPHQLGLLAVAMLTSKGASGVTGAGFITLAATLQAVPGIPIESLALLVGIDRFMSECRALTNLMGNAVGTLALSKMEGELA